MLIYSNLPTIVTGYVWNFADNSSVFQETWRNVIYLVQAESCISQHMASFLERQPSTERDVMVLSWRKPCIDWTRNLSNVVYIFDNTTTWSSGRNRLYGIALNRSHEYLYYIFLDEDLEFHFTANTPRDIYSRGTEHPLTAFENFLRGYEPAIGLCNYNKACSARATTGRLPKILPATIHFDAAINAFHAKAIRSLLPYRLDYEAISWWESQKYVILASDVLFRGQVTQYTTVTAINKKHRPYSRKHLANYASILKDVRSWVPEMYQNQSVFHLEPLVFMTATVNGNVLQTQRWNISIPAPKTPIVPFGHFDSNIFTNE